MEHHAYAVIGAGYGDEGKGLAVDALARDLCATGQTVVVVRSNGGAQAGHGVERPDGRRHVFHHIGSGTLAGAQTHLSRFFVANPLMLRRELAEIAAWGLRPTISVDPRALMTTPWDVALNQAAERARGGGRHGSCGMGFGETIERQENGFGLDIGAMRDLLDVGYETFVARIREDWLPARAQRLGIPGDDPLIARVLGAQAIADNFRRDVEDFFEYVDLRSDADLSGRGTILFEGAQGLELDMDLGHFPHVTRSRTGVCNMAEISAEAGIGAISAFYMTRTYRTRHGAGPLPDQTDLSAYLRIVDRTNVPNDWQGEIRAAPLDPVRLGAMVRRDMARSGAAGIIIEPMLGVTCLDQIHTRCPIVAEGKIDLASDREILATIADMSCLPIGLKSTGPCREDARILTATSLSVPAPSAGVSPSI